MEKPLKVRHGVICRTPNQHFGYWGWPSVAKMEDGTLVAACSGFRLRHIDPFGKNTLFYSRDEGKTWSPPVVANDTRKDDRDAGIVSLGGKKLLLTWFNHPREAYTHTYYEIMKGDMTPAEQGLLDGMIRDYAEIPDELYRPGSFLRVSEDGGITWSEARQSPVSAPHGPIVLRDGSLFYLGREFYSQLPQTDPEDKEALLACVSRDEGRSWQRMGRVPLPANVDPKDTTVEMCEPHALELPSGRILGMIRFQSNPVHPAYQKGFTILLTHSDDGGKSWSAPTHIDVSGFPPHLLRHSSGAIVCVYGRREEPFGERAMVSWDEGESWDTEYVLHNDGICVDLGYPASVELSDGSILTVYYQKVGEDRDTSILYSVWELPERP